MHRERTQEKRRSLRCHGLDQSKGSKTVGMSPLAKMSSRCRGLDRWNWVCFSTWKPKASMPQQQNKPFSPLSRATASKKVASLNGKEEKFESSFSRKETRNELSAAPPNA